MPSNEERFNAALLALTSGEGEGDYELVLPASISQARAFFKNTFVPVFPNLVLSYYGPRRTDFPLHITAIWGVSSYPFIAINFEGNEISFTVSLRTPNSVFLDMFNISINNPLLTGSADIWNILAKQEEDSRGNE